MSCLQVLDQHVAHTVRFFEAFSELAQEISSDVYDAASEICRDFGDMLDDHYIYMGRQVVNFTSAQLGDEAAKFVNQTLNVVRDVAIRSFYAAPVTAISLLAPAWISTPLWIGYTVLHLAKDKPFTNFMYDNINTGMRNAFLVRAGSSIGQFLATGNPVHALSSIISLAIAGVWHGKVPATDDPEEPNKGENLNKEPLLENDNRVEDVTDQTNDDEVDDVNHDNLVLETREDVLVGHQ